MVAVYPQTSRTCVPLSALSPAQCFIILKSVWSPECFLTASLYLQGPSKLYADDINLQLAKSQQLLVVATKLFVLCWSGIWELSWGQGGIQETRVCTHLWCPAVEDVEVQDPPCVCSSRGKLLRALGRCETHVSGACVRESSVTRLCMTFYDPLDCSPPGFFVHGIFRVGCHFLFQMIFPTQGLDLSFLHWQVDSLPLSHLASPHI